MQGEGPQPAGDRDASPLASALRWFDELLASRVTSVDARVAKALVLASAGRVDRAEAELAALSATARGSLPGNAVFVRARCLRQMGRFAEALSMCRALRLDMPQVSDLDLDIEEGLNLCGLGRTDEAIRALEDAIERHGQRPERILVVVCLARVLCQAGRPEEGLRFCDAALAEPELRHPGLLAQRAECLILLGRWDAAAADLDDALARDPTLATGHAHRGLLHLVREEVEPARASFRRAVARNPGLRELCQGWWDYDSQRERLF